MRVKRNKLSDEEKRALRFIKAMGGLPEVMRGFQKGMTYESDLAGILYGNPYAKVDERQAIHDVCKRLEEEEKHSKFLNGWGGFDEFVRFFEEVLGRYAEEAKTLDELLDAIDQATLPQGCTWPKDRNGKSIKPNDPVHINGDKMRIVAISHKDKLCIRPWEKVNGDGGFWVKSSEVSLAPCNEGVCAENKVLDADGAEIRVGDTVYALPGDWCGRWPCFGMYAHKKMTVKTLDNGRDDGSVTCVSGVLTCYPQPSQLTHRAPVLAADGKPLCEGETVYVVEDEPYGANLFIGDSVDVVNIFKNGDVTVTKHDGTDYAVDGGNLSHERPVADSWERLEEDAEKLACEYFGRKEEKDPCSWCRSREIDPCTAKDCELNKTIDLVRRAKKLAGVQ